MRIPERNKSLILQLLNISEPSGTSSLFDARAQIFKYRSFWVKYSRARSQTPKEVAIVFTSFLTRLVRRRITYSSSASFLPQIDAKVRSVLLRPLRRIVCSPKPNQLKNRFSRNIFIVMAFLRCSNLHAVHCPKNETESSFYCFIFEARRFTAAIFVRPL